MAGLKVGCIQFSRSDASWDEVFGAAGQLISLPANPDHTAALLYEMLHRLDRANLDLILVERPPDTPEWAAVRDRLTRAAASG